MTSSLNYLFEAIYHAQSEQDLRSHIAPQIGCYFEATRHAIFFFDHLRLEEGNVQKILDIALSVEHNPIARYLTERHAPAHEGLVTTPKTWALICPRADHWHVMAGPIVNGGQLVGAVGCTRKKAEPAFNHDNLVDLSAICLHLSAWAATQKRRNVSAEDLQQCINSQAKNLRQRLTSRELQIAGLVAQGKTNSDIGKQLWITENSVKQALKRMFRKLEVSSRAEMVAQLALATFEPLGATLDR